MECEEIEVHDPRWVEILKGIPHDVYHLPGYVRLESQRTNSQPKAVIAHEADKVLFLPYMVREGRFGEMGESVRDVISPYGYPGFLVNSSAAEDKIFLERAWRKILSYWRELDICSAFIRAHPILNAELISRFPPEHCFGQGETVSIDLSSPRDIMWKQIRPSIRTAINRGKALGYLPRMVPFKDHLPDFFQVYRETMQRVNPENRLPYEFFSSLADILDGSLHLCVVESEGKVICAGLKSVCGGIVQGMWGGTLSEYISESPFSLMVWFSSLWAKSEGYEFMHLGGGVGSRNDSLFR